jgi:hypothetical protein
MDKYDGKVVTLEDRYLNGHWSIKEDSWVFRESWMKLVIGVDMVKEYLENGDMVELRNGTRLIVFNGRMFSKEDSWSLEPFRPDMTNSGCFGDELDIMKVYKQPNRPFMLLEKETPLVGWDWIREEVKEITMAEVEEKFGCKVKIIKGDNE